MQHFQPPTIPRLPCRDLTRRSTRLRLQTPFPNHIRGSLVIIILSPWFKRFLLLHQLLVFLSLIHHITLRWTRQACNAQVTLITNCRYAYMHELSYNKSTYTHTCTHTAQCISYPRVAFSTCIHRHVLLVGSSTIVVDRTTFAHPQLPSSHWCTF